MEYDNKKRASNNHNEKYKTSQPYNNSKMDNENNKNIHDNITKKNSKKYKQHNDTNNDNNPSRFKPLCFLLFLFCDIFRNTSNTENKQ